MAKKEKEKVEEIKDKEAKAQALKLALQRLEKSFGKGTVMRLGDKVAEKVEVQSLIHISEPTRIGMFSYAVFCLKKKTPHPKRPLPMCHECNVVR